MRYINIYLLFIIYYYMCAHGKHPISICRKKIKGLTAGGMETRKRCRQRRKHLGSAVLYVAARFPPSKAARIVRV